MDSEEDLEDPPDDDPSDDMLFLSSDEDILEHFFHAQESNKN